MDFPPIHHQARLKTLTKLCIIAKKATTKFKEEMNTQKFQKCKHFKDQITIYQNIDFTSCYYYIILALKLANVIFLSILKSPYKFPYFGVVWY